jgi:hypothetical protein
MTFFARSLAIAAVVGHTTTVLAASCEDVYQNNVRDKYYSESDYSSLNTLYDNLCSSSGERKSQSWDSSMSVVVKAIPIKMTGNAKSDVERASAFCRYYSSLRLDTSHSVVARDEIVVAALQNYNACKEIEARSGVVVTHKFADPHSIVVNFDFKNTNQYLVIDGVLAANMTCRSNEAPKGEEILSQQSHFEMRRNFAITCRRPDPTSDQARYAAGSLAIGTNVTSYTISLPSDSIYNNELASAATSKIRGLEASLQATQSEASSLAEKLAESAKKINGLRLVQHRIVIGQHNPGGGMEHHGCGTNMDVVKDSKCKGAHQATVVPGMGSGGHQCGYQSFVVSCIYLGQ